MSRCYDAFSYVSDSESSVDDALTSNCSINDAISSLSEAYRCCLICFQEGDTIVKNQMYSTMIQIRSILQKTQTLKNTN
ncbi:hypothetical protein QTN25_010271 [Entamoeba marina]